MASSVTSAIEVSDLLELKKRTDPSNVAKAYSVVAFFAKDVAECEHIRRVTDALAKRFPALPFIQVDVRSAEEELVQHYDVTHVPLVLVLHVGSQSLVILRVFSEWSSRGKNGGR